MSDNKEIVAMIEFQFDHIGVAVFNIEAGIADYQLLGYHILGGIKSVEVFKANAAYMTLEGSPTIELLEPTSDDSPVAKILKQRGAGTYHTCYGVKRITDAMSYLREKAFLPLGKPVPGPGLDNALTVFLYKKSIGLIQLVEKDE